MSQERMPYVKQWPQPIRSTDFDFIVVDEVDNEQELFVAWVAERPTRIHRFEVDHYDQTSIEQASVTSLRVGNQEQLAAGPIPPSLLTHGLVVPRLEPGTVLTVTLTRFLGRIKPVGEEVLRADEVDALPACKRCGAPRYVAGDCLNCISNELGEAIREEEKERWPWYWTALGVGAVYWLGLFLARWTPIAPCLASTIMLYTTLRGWRLFTQLEPAVMGDMVKMQTLRITLPILSLWDWRLGMIAFGLDLLCTAGVITYLWSLRHASQPPND